MPPPDDAASLPAHLRPIDFPAGVATTARDACDRVATLLEEHLGARPDLVAEARDGWEGAYRDEFDETWAIQETRLSGLKEDLATLRGAIDGAIADAATLDTQRATLRQEYWAEQAAEREAS